MISKIYRFLSSIKVTIILLILLSIIFLSGLWIPQKSLLKQELYIQWKAQAPSIVSILEAVGFTNIYTAPFTVFIWAVFFMNLSLVLTRRITVVRKITSLSLPSVEGLIDNRVYPYRTTTTFNTGSISYERIKSMLQKMRYDIVGNKSGFYAVRNRFSPYAGIIFHLSFYIMLIGGILSIYTKFDGILDLAEGEAFYGEIERYNTPPRLPKIGEPPKFNILIEKIEPEITAGVPTGIKVMIKDINGESRRVEVNKPYKVKNASMVIRQMGIAPLFVITGRNGKEIDGAYVKLDVLNGKRDWFEMAELDFAVRFFPDYALEDDREFTRSQEFKNPVFSIFVKKDRDYIEKIKLSPGDKAEIGDYYIYLPELRFWVRFYVVKEYGAKIAFAGFWVAIIALLWRFLFYRREIIGMVKEESGGDTLYISGRAEFYKVLFEDEFKELIEGLEGMMKISDIDDIQSR